MKSNELIQSLSGNLKPVKILKYELKDYFLIFFAGLFSALAGIAISGVRADIKIMATTPSFITQTIALILLALLSTISALHMSIPSLKKAISQKIILSTLLFWTMTILYLLLNSKAPFAGWGFGCASEIALNSIIPSAFIFFMIRKSASLDRLSVGWLVLTAGAAYGALATQFSCAIDDPFHLLVWHTLPVIIIGLIGLGIGRFILKKV